MIAAGTEPVTKAQVEQAWEAYQATQMAICAKPALLENEHFTALQDTAYARFRGLFQRWDGAR